MIFEKIAANILEGDASYAESVIFKIEPKYIYDDVEKFLLFKIKKFNEKYKSLPSYKNLKSYLEDAGVGPNEIGTYQDVEQFKTDLKIKIKSIDNVIKKGEVSDRADEYLLRSTEDYVKANYLRSGTSQIDFILNNGSNNVEKPSELIETAKTFTLTEFESYDPFAEILTGNFHKDLSENSVKIPFGVSIMDKMYGGGIEKGSLACVMATTGGGKSIIMSHTAIQAVLRGYNILYITLEMAEKKVNIRTTANMLDIPKSDLEQKYVSDEELRVKTKSLMNKHPYMGKFRIKKYPQSVATCADFRNAINEYRVRENIIFDMVVIDYIGIVASSSKKDSSLYESVKAVAEEMRNLAEEFNVAVFTGTQANRSAYDQKKGQINLSHVADSMGLTHTCDIFFYLESGGDFAANNSALIVQLKNRDGDKDGKYSKVAVGLDKSKMKFYDLDATGINTTLGLIGIDYQDGDISPMKTTNDDTTKRNSKSFTKPLEFDDE